MKRAVHHTTATIKEALGKISSGWTHERIAKKYKVHFSTVYGWKKRYPSAWKLPTTTTKTTITNVNTKGNNVIVTAENELVHRVSIGLTDTTFKSLRTLAAHEVRTPEDQVKYLVLRELDRVKRNNNNIPF